MSVTRRRRGRRRQAVRTAGGRALLLGDRNLAVALSAAGVSVTAVGGRTVAVRWSRFVDDWLEDPRPDEDALVSTLLDRAASQPGPAALFYQFDDDLLFASRRREELSRGLLVALPPPDLVEQLVDKAAFQALAVRTGLPVPPAHVLDLTSGLDAVADLQLPVLLKPTLREASWTAAVAAKAVVVEDRDALPRIVDLLAHDHRQVIAQEIVPGPESRIESYHVHVDAGGTVRAEFTGRKVRTHPAAMGHSTALTTTDEPDVRRLGRELTERVGLRGVAKFDFKRDPDGRLWLLEVNPRFNLWHHVGAAAGVNIPESVWRELLGLAPLPRRVARPGVSWCQLERDVLAAREAGMGVGRWALWAARADTRSTVDPVDPLPALAGLLRGAYQRLARR
jgi:D-aspartate ligase